MQVLFLQIFLPGEGCTMPKISETQILHILRHYSFDCCFVEDANRIIIYVSDSYKRITGLDPDTLIGKPTSILHELGLVDKPVTETGKRISGAYTSMVNYPNGKSIITTVTPCVDDTGRTIAFVGNIRDITELNSLKEQLQRKDENIRHLEELLRTMELNNVSEEGFIMESPVMKQLAGLASRLSKVNSTVLITGESGVGKDVYAQLILRLSQKDMDHKPAFIKVSCGAIPESLLESELFGYEYGAFTGARKNGKPGAFELAQDGILFLDEIGELPLSLQVKLLTVLQDREFTRLGGTKPQKMRARLIAATNQDLEQLVAEKKFRGDLYYRLNVLPVYIPPLRERKEDIVPLVNFFSERMNQRYDMEKRFSQESIHCMLQYSWPGNIRELSNIVERTFVFSPTDIISPQMLPLDIQKNLPTGSLPFPTDVPLTDFLENAEKFRIEQALNKCGTLKEVASDLGIDQSTLTRKMRKYHFPYKNNKNFVRMD